MNEQNQSNSFSKWRFVIFKKILPEEQELILDFSWVRSETHRKDWYSSYHVVPQGAMCSESHFGTLIKSMIPTFPKSKSDQPTGF